MINIELTKKDARAILRKHVHNDIKVVFTDDGPQLVLELNRIKPRRVSRAKGHCAKIAKKKRLIAGDFIPPSPDLELVKLVEDILGVE